MRYGILICDWCIPGEFENQAQLYLCPSCAAPPDRPKANSEDGHGNHRRGWSWTSKVEAENQMASNMTAVWPGGTDWRTRSHGVKYKFRRKEAGVGTLVVEKKMRLNIDY